MDHAPGSNTFQLNYFNRHVSFDLWALHRNFDPQNEIVLAVASHGSTQSNYRPVGLTVEQTAALNEHPLLNHLRQQVDNMPRFERSEGRRRIKKLKDRLYRQKKKEVRKEWSIQQAVSDIESQLRGTASVDQATMKARQCKPMSAPHQ